MAASLSLQSNLVLSLFPYRTTTRNPLFPRTQFVHNKPFLRDSLFVAKLGLRPDPESAGHVIRELFDRAESLLYTIADAAVSSSSETVITAKQNSDWLSGITNAMETVLKVLKGGLSTLHVPYAYGFSIILLTVLVKAATFPLTKKQVESAMAMRSLTPQIKAIQERYAGDQERIQLETARLYKLAGINPLAGCLPTLATIPVWIGLYRALSNVADEGLLSEGFFWIPSLAGPTTIADRQNGSSISWLFPFVDGHPPLGWSATLAYLVLPLLLVVSQYISVQIMQSSQSNDPNMKSSQAITNFLPLMIGYFALSVPSGLSLYWFTNNVLSTAQQVWLQKLGNAKNPMKQFNDIIKENQLEVKKSVSELKSTKEASQAEKLTVEGLRPGERFKQLKKEQDASQAEKLTAEGLRPGERFKQLKEQEARRRQQREEEKRNAEESAARVSQVTNGKPESLTGRETSIVGVVNGGPSSQEFKEDTNSIPVFKTENSEASDNSTSLTPDNKLSEENTHQAERE